MAVVAITGAAGRIGSVLREALRGEYERLVLLDRVDPGPAGEGESVGTADLLDGAAMRDALAGVDAVVHLGGIADEAPLPDLLAANVLGTQHVLEAARIHGIRRVVLASSNRAAGFYPVSHLTAVEDVPRPDGLYGVSKVAVEALGQLYADKFGLSVVCLRIGSFEERPSEPRHLATWLSPGDMAGYVRAALAAPSEPGCEVAYAVSANTRRFWQLRAAFYTPRDDAEEYASSIPGATTPLPAGTPQAGDFASPEYTLKHVASAGTPPGTR